MAKDDDLSIFDELDNKLDDFFAEDDDLFSEEDDFFTGDGDDFSGENAVGDADDEMPPEDDELAAEDSRADLVEDPAVKEDVQTSVAAEKKIEDYSENPLQSLKIIVLEMDWEISDENLEKYLAEIKRLIVSYQDDRPIYLFFKLHATIGEYMLKKKARAHPEALKFLYSVYNSLENALKADVPLIEKNRLILDEVNNFKSLKMKLFPDLYSAESEGKAPVESAEKQEDAVDETAGFDISKLPDDVQNGINTYIEKMIAKKIESMNKSN